MKIILSILSGLLISFVFEPFSFTFLAFFCFIPYLFVIEREHSLLKMIFYSWIVVFTHYIVSFYWIKETAFEFGGLPNYLCIIVLILFSIFSVFYLQIFSVFYFFFRKRIKNGHVFYLLILPSLFIISENLDPKIFNWYIGNSLSSYPLLFQFADVFGVLGLSFIVFLINVIIYKIIIEYTLFKKIKIYYLTFLFFIVTCLFIYGFIRYKKFSEIDENLFKLKIGVVQGNIGNPQKLDVGERIKLENNFGYSSEYDLIYTKYEFLTKKLFEENKKIDLIVWPETAFPDVYTMSSKNARRHKNLISDLKVNSIIGGYYGEYIDNNWKYYNSAIKISNNGEIDYYHKYLLLPFSEYLPSSFKFLHKYISSISDFSKGDGPKIFVFNIDGKEIKIAPNICYEILKKDYIRKTSYLNPHIILNLTNDSWFGRVEPYQHLRLAKMRAVELRRPIVRSTNTGITTYINMLGETNYSTNLFSEETPIYDVSIVDNEYQTFYASFGHMLVYFLMIISLLIFIFRKKR